jgi:uncharacterized protein YceK
MKDIIPILLAICVLNSCNTMMSVNAANNAERAARRAASLADDNNQALDDLRYVIRSRTRGCN